MTEYCDQCDQELAEYHLCQECIDDLTGSYEEEIKDLERERDMLLDLCKAVQPKMYGMLCERWGHPDNWPKSAEGTLIYKRLYAVISDGNGEDK